MNFVFITYPYHYHITQVAIKKVLDFYPNSNITIMFDDVIQISDIDFVSEIKRDLSALGVIADIIPFSKIIEATKFDKGWERQQIVKLYLHTVLELDNWICIDGDTLLQEKLDWSSMYINLGDAKYPWPHHYNLINYILDLNYQQIKFNGITLNSVSGMPIKFMRKQMLIGLHEYIQQLHNCNVVDVLKSFTLQKNLSRYFDLAEWDLMGYYEIFVTKDNLPFEELPFIITPTSEFTKECPHKIKVLHGRDNLPVDWYRANSIRVNPKVYTILYGKG